MQINASNELVFRGTEEQHVLYEIHRNYRRNELLGDVSFDEFVLRLQDDLCEKSDIDDYRGAISPGELEATIATSEIVQLRSAGRSTGEDIDDARLATSMRKLAACALDDIEYTLAPKWAPVIIAGSFILCGTFVERRDDLFSLLIDGAAEEDIELAPFDHEALGIEPLSPEADHEINVMLAQHRFDIVRHATDMLMTLAEHFKITYNL